MKSIDEFRSWSLWLSCGVNGATLVLNSVFLVRDLWRGDAVLTVLQSGALLVGGVTLYWVMNHETKFREEIAALRARRSVAEQVAEVVRTKGGTIEIEGVEEVH